MKTIQNSLFDKIEKQKYLILMICPAVVLVTIFAYLPLSGWIMAFKDYQIGRSIWGGEWLWFKQFKLFLFEASDSFFVIRNTIVINSLTITINLLGACIFAVLLSEIQINGYRRIIQTLSFFPYFISWAITYIIFHTFLSQNSGILNKVLVNTGIVSEGINFLGNAKLAWPLILFVNAWRYIGYNAVIFFAAICNIDQEQYEAAEIDGAGRFGKIFHITVPNLIPTLVILLVMNAGWIFSSDFEQYYLFSNPTNWQRMEVFDIYIYKYGLKLLDYSYATAVGILKTIASIIMLLIVNGIAKKLSNRSIF